MTNIELEQKVKEIIAEENMFDMIEKALSFEKEYKQTSFYKTTKMPILSVIEKAKMFYFKINFDELFKQLQDKISSLNLDNINDLMNQIANIFESENNEIYNMINEVKDIDIFNN